MTEAERLLHWFDANARPLPWREEPRNPYRVLVSELMLQQTQVDRVIPRYEEFITTFPDLASLAAASEERVLALWSGLGYYRRARLLHRLAREVVGEGGELPSTARELQRLPGVGPYTAAAVASLVHGEAVPVLDGNVARVASRILELTEDPRSAVGRRKLLDWIEGLLADGAPGQVNEALMELGATVCRPQSPRCGACPLARDCAARAKGAPERYPRPRHRRSILDLRWVAACCVDERGLWLVRQVTDGPILRGLWLPPVAALGDDEDPALRAQSLLADGEWASVRLLDEVRHSITHRRIRVTPVVLLPGERYEAGSKDRWVDPRSTILPTSTLLRKLIQVYDSNDN